jgi:hypothetical protein
LLDLHNPTWLAIKKDFAAEPIAVMTTTIEIIHP